MSILNTNKSIVIQTDQGQVYVGKNFTIEMHQPISGFVKITDHDNEGAIYWFNFNAITWIGPRV